MAITTPDAVPGEVIEAAWGDAVRTDLTAIDTIARAAVPKAGGTMTGTLQVGGDPFAAAIGQSLSTIGQLNQYVSTTTNWFAVKLNSVAGEDFGRFHRRASAVTTEIGSIRQVGTTGVAFNTSSDPRLKSGTETRGISDAAERARQLGGAAWSGQWLDADSGEPAGETWDFLSSHDIEDVAGYAVTGERDATDDDGNPVYQQVNYGALVPLLFAALSDALDRIAALEGAAA